MPIERVTKAEEVQSQQLILQNRQELSITGTSEVLSFSDTAIELDTNQGILLIKGEKLRIISVSTQAKTAEICGRVNALEYKNPRTGKSILKNIFK